MKTHADKLGGKLRIGLNHASDDCLGLSQGLGSDVVGGLGRRRLRRSDSDQERVRSKKLHPVKEIMRGKKIKRERRPFTV